MGFECCDSGALLYVLLDTIKSCYALTILRHIQIIAVDPQFAFSAVSRLSDISWYALRDQELFLYTNTDGNIVVLLIELFLLRRSASRADLREGGHAEAMPRHCEAFADLGMST